MNPLSLTGTNAAANTGWQDRLMALSSRKAAAAAQPSVQVTLGASTATDDTYAPGGQSAAERYSNDALGAMLERNAGAASASGLFAGLGKALLSRLGADGSDVKLTSAAPTATTQASLVAPPMDTPPSDTSLSVKLTSGASVKITLHSGEDGLSIDMSSSQSLSAEDRQSVARLGGAFQDMLDGMSSTPPKLSLQGLTEGDSRIASVDFKANVPTLGGAAQTIDFHAGTDTRSVKVDGPGGKIDVAMDMRNTALWGNQNQRKAAISNYLDQIDAATSRGQGDKKLAGLFKDAFSQLNASYPPAAATTPSDGVRNLNAKDHAVLTGLADFTATIGQASSAPNPMHPEELDTFSYQLSQQTRLGGIGANDRTIDQQQSSHLKASYHTAPSPGASMQMGGKPELQNYIYRQIDDSATTNTHMAYVKGRLVAASVTQSASQTTHDKKYIMGQMVSETTSPAQRTHTEDLLSLLDPPRKKGDDAQPPAVSQATLDRVHAMTGLISSVGAIKAS